MITVKDAVQYHLEYTFEKEAWQPSLAMSFEGLTAAQAAWKPGPERHSIWQIVRHVTRWKRAVFDDWNGRKPNYEEVERGDWQDASGDEVAWHADVRALRDISERFMSWLQAKGDGDIWPPMTPTMPGRSATSGPYRGSDLRAVSQAESSRSQPAPAPCRSRARR